MLTRWVLIGCLCCTAACLMVVGGALASGAASPGRELAYMSYAAINPDIYLTDLPHGLTLNLTDHTAYDAQPIWSPDGRWLAFVSDRDGLQTVYLLAPGQGDARRLIDDGEPYTTPQWTENGEQLVIRAPRQGANTFYIVNRDGTGLTLIQDGLDPITGREIDLDLQANDGWRAISPDGQWFAFMTFRQQRWGIFIGTQPNAENARLLAEIGRFTEAFAWSPDGELIAYPAYINGMYDLFTVPFEGGNPIRLTFGRAIDTAPAWRPSGM